MVRFPRPLDASLSIIYRAVGLKGGGKVQLRDRPQLHFRPYCLSRTCYRSGKCRCFGTDSKTKHFLIGLREGVVEPRESGKPAIGFPLSLAPPGRRECGNRGAISKGGGKGGKPVFGFPDFPRTVISTAFAFAVWSNCDHEVECFPGPLRFQEDAQANFEISLGDVSRRPGGYWRFPQAAAYNRAAVTKKPFTAKQGQYLAFIFYYTKIRGFAPAESDMQNYFKVSPP